MRILLLTQWFNPEPIFKGLTFARELSERGHQVSVLTSLPHYPTGKLYEGYRLRPYQRENYEGVSVLRTFVYPSYDRSVLRRAATYGSFALSSSLAALTVKRADVVYVYHPPATIALPALLLRYLRRTPIVYDIQDLWPDTLGATEMVHNRLFLRSIEAWCRITYRAASRIVVLSPGFRKELISRGVAPEKIEVIYNWSDERQIVRCAPEAAVAERLGMTGRFNVVFSGTMGVAQGLDTVLDAARECETRLPRVQFVFVGGGTEVERLRDRSRQLGLSNVIFLPRRPMSEMAEVLSLADVLLVHLKKDPLFRITIPSKTQASMAAGRPILMAVEGDAADLVRDAGCGICCEPENPASMLRALEHLVGMTDDELRQMGENGLAYYRERLSLSVGVDRFERVFESVVRGRGPGAGTQD
jgi:colanic acid biosynthesis glycosyl transferase WcaI